MGEGGCGVISGRPAWRLDEPASFPTGVKDVATSMAPLSPSPRHREEACGKTTVFLHDTCRRGRVYPCIAQVDGSKYSLRKNNVRETRSDISKPNRSHIMWVRPDVLGLFLDNVRSFSIIVGSWPLLVKCATVSPEVSS